MIQGVVKTVLTKKINPLTFFSSKKLNNGSQGQAKTLPDEEQMKMLL
jgi:hypothetical protein